MTGIPGGGGNDCVCIGGEWNGPDAGAAPNWGNPLCGLTELTVLLTIRPDAPLTAGTTPGALGMLIGQGDSQVFRSTFHLRYDSGTIVAFVTDGTHARAGSCLAPDLTGGNLWRIAMRWAASGDLLKLDINGTSRPVTLFNDGGAFYAAISTLTSNPALAVAPLEIGAQSNSDTPLLNGTYNDVALLRRYMTDNEVTEYGLGVSPHLLGVEGHLKYVKLTAATATGPGPSGTPHGIVFDEWSGERYGLAPQSPYTVTPTGYYQGAFSNWTNVAHPPVTYSRANPTTDYAVLPERRFTLDELLRTPTGLGPRSGRVFHVPAGTITDPHGGATTFTPATLQRAVDLAQNWYHTGADDIEVLHTATLPESVLIPDRGGKTPTPLGTDTPYIHVYTDALGSLPAPAIRTITGVPGVGSYPVLHESARVDRSHRPLLATIQPPTMTAAITTAPNACRYWYFSGFRLLQNADQSAEGGNLLNIRGPDQVPYGYGPAETDSNHLIFSQCLIEGDPLKTGVSNGSPVAFSGQYLAFIFGGVIDCYGFTSGEVQTFTCGSAGPFHLEMGVTESFLGAGMFSGGNSVETRVNNLVADVIYRRMLQIIPLLWCPSEPMTFLSAAFTGWNTHIGVVGSQSFVSYKSGPFNWQGGERGGPWDGGYFYEPATGKARQIKNDWRLLSPTVCELVSPWPGGTQDNVLVFIQTPHLLYNSGTQWPLGQCSTNGTTTVTFVEPIPASIDPDGPDGPVFLYQNNNHWTGVGEVDTGSTTFRGFPDTPCRRRRILTIAANRLSCTLDGPYTQTMTTTYSLTHFDGMARNGFGHNKSGMEFKSSARVLQEGNVLVRVSGERQYPVDQGAGYVVGPITITGNHVTWPPGQTPAYFRGFEYQFRLFGKPWIYFVLNNAVGPNVATGYSASASILVDTIDPDDNGCTIVPGTSRAQTQIGVPFIQSGNVVALLFVMPWHTSTEKVWRYNLWYAGGPPSMFTGGQSGPEATKALHLHWHDNLQVEHGKYNFASWDAISSVAAHMPTGNAARDASGNLLWGQTVDGTNGTEHYHHNTIVRARSRGFRQAVWAIYIPLDSGSYDKSPDNDFNDNVIDGLDAPETTILGGGTNGSNGPGQPPINVANIWTTPYSVRRSIFIGSGAPSAVALPDFNAFPDNVGLLSRSLVGFTNAETTDPVELLNPLSYVLQDLYTTGTVSLPIGSVNATFSGPLPASVVAGQFLKIPSSVKAPVRLQSVNNAAGTAVLGQPYDTSAGYTAVGFAITFKGTASDGLDPGANLPLIKAMTEGVMLGSVVTPPGIPSPPSFTGTPYHAGDTVVNGFGEVGATLTLFDNGLSVGTTAVSIAGTWSKPTAPLIGGHVLTATQTNGVGTSSPSGPTTVVSSLAPPVITGTPYHVGDTVVTGSGQAGGTARLLRNGVAGAPVAINGSGLWSAPASPALITGEVLTATQSDGTNTSGPSTPTTVLANPPVPPVLTGIPYHAGDTLVTGTGVVGASVTLYLNGVASGSSVVSGSGIWSQPVSPLTEGQVLTATQTTVGGTSTFATPTNVLAAVVSTGLSGALLLAGLVNGVLLLDTSDALLLTGGDRLKLAGSPRLLITRPIPSGNLLLSTGDGLELTTGAGDNVALAGPEFTGGTAIDALLLSNITTTTVSGVVAPRTYQGGLGSRSGARQAR